MHKRYLDCNASELAAIGKADLLDAIRASEGRLIVSETIGTVQPMLMTITNAELAASQGADLILLNVFDANNPVVNGLPAGTPPDQAIAELKRLTGRVIGVNLEPVEPGYRGDHEEEVWRMVPGRLATPENAARLAEMGAGFILLTGNPGNGISNREITHSLRAIHQAVGDRLVLIAGKMHAAGILSEAAENIITRDDINEFAANGADIILLPAPGTVPGISTEYVRELVTHAHSLGVMTLTAIGTSQEGADTETIRQIALMSKMTGTDLHHLGDAGYIGVALPENIFTYGLAIRGRRHTYARMARSVRR
ncbi:DUF7916 family protein [Enterobacillus tribolii]|uniref:DUF7916 domain-containing protein n=1 Tax=Enterobacillus tribolii TaxID=1487935 RepID=A0A370R3J3_9GAMM|nr:haloacid dehalogenase-like hydrolase [Enterobacillus tribolii]MBW7983685.1 haloacid dehalogenase-like hydrolase [Enterobacillus tribolii]RDK96615.1 hypothetical protein C8D90_10143 [Enterobacillus tribolii]